MTDIDEGTTYYAVGIGQFEGERAVSIRIGDVGILMKPSGCRDFLKLVAVALASIESEVLK